MPITIHCPHCKTELSFVPDEKTPEGLLECSKCKCTFRICLAQFNGKCYEKLYPNAGKFKEEKKPKIIKEETGMDIQDDFPAIPAKKKSKIEEVKDGEIISGFPAHPEKKKRGRPKKIVEVIHDGREYQ